MNLQCGKCCVEYVCIPCEQCGAPLRDSPKYSNADTRRRLITTTEGRVAYLNALRSVVSRRCPLNKMGVPLVTDYDLIDATEEEQAEALATVVKRLKLIEPEIPLT